jgi:hypothetical protein
MCKYKKKSTSSKKKGMCNKKKYAYLTHKMWYCLLVWLRQLNNSENYISFFFTGSPEIGGGYTITRVTKKIAHPKPLPHEIPLYQPQTSSFIEAIYMQLIINQ